MALDDDGNTKKGRSDEDESTDEDETIDDEELEDAEDFEDDDDDLNLSTSRGGVVRFFVRTVLVVGAGLLVIGLSLLALFGVSNLQTPGGFILGGLLLLVIYGVLEPETVRAFAGQGQVQAGSRALFGVLLVLGAVFLLNVVVRDRLGDKHIDVTKDRVNSLAPQTETVVKGLDNEVTATVWWNQSPSETQTAYDLLQRMHNVNHKLVVKQKSLVDDPATARKLALQQSSVVFEYPNRQPQVATDMTEAGLDTALIRLSTGRSPKVYFLTGHGEGPIQAAAQGASGGINYSRLASSLATQGITTAQLNLLTGSGSGGTVQPGQVPTSPAAQPSPAPDTASPAPTDTGTPSPGATPSQVSGTAVPKDADAVVILDPTTNLTAPEIQALTGYLDGGGHLLLAEEPTTQTNVNDIIKKYGLSIGPGIVLDQSLQYNQIAVAGILVIQQYGSHIVTRGLQSTPTLIVQSAPVEGQVAQDQGLQLTPLITTTKSSCERTDSNQKAGTCQSGDKNGPFSLMSAVGPPDGSKDVKPRLVLLGGAQFVSDQILGSQLGAPGNLAIMNNAVNWLAGQDKIIDVPVRATQPNTIFVTDAQHQLILIGYTMLLPIFVAALGVAVYLRRR
ncbi:MAG: Gldg family protein [Candidatus Dormibacteraeota bacterium]|nr:Gldg family protein [Candidatus Dormibacteraeota bacterium]